MYNNSFARMIYIFIIRLKRNIKRAKDYMTAIDASDRNKYKYQQTAICSIIQPITNSETSAIKQKMGDITNHSKRIDFEYEFNLRHRLRNIFTIFFNIISIYEFYLHKQMQNLQVQKGCIVKESENKYKNS